jgi:hypothetical protein
MHIYVSYMYRHVFILMNVHVYTINMDPTNINMSAKHNNVNDEYAFHLKKIMEIYMHK